MSLLAIASGVVAIAKAVPMVKKLLDQITDIWIDYQVSRMDSNQSEIMNERRALAKAIKNAQSDSERIALSRVLSKSK